MGNYYERGVVDEVIDLDIGSGGDVSWKLEPWAEPLTMYKATS